MLLSSNLHKKSSEVSTKTRSPSASLSFIDHATKHAIVKWSILRSKNAIGQTWYGMHLRTIPWGSLQTTTWTSHICRFKLQFEHTIVKFFVFVSTQHLAVYWLVAYFAKIVECKQVSCKKVTMPKRLLLSDLSLDVTASRKIRLLL